MATTLDNFVRSVLATDATAADTQLVLAKSAPPLRDPPAATEDAPGILVLQDVPSAPTKIEIVRYTGRTIIGNQVTLTGVTRAQEGTTAQSWTAGTPTLQGITAGLISQKMDIGDTAVAATKLVDARTFALTGVVTAAAVSFDGTGDVSLATAIADGALTFAKVSGLQAALDAKLPKSGGTITGGLGVSGDATFGGDIDLGAAGTISQTTGIVTLSERPTFDGNVPWDAGNFNPSNYVPKTGTTMTGSLAITAAATNLLELSGTGGVAYSGQFFTNGVVRWLTGAANFNTPPAGIPSGAFFVYEWPNSVNRMAIAPNNGPISFTGAMNVSGNVTAPDFIATSDRNLKDRIHPLDRGLDALRRMRPRSYTKYDNPDFHGIGKPEVGFIAQEVETVLPSAMVALPNGYKGVSYGQVTALLAAALLEVDDRVTKLEER